VRVKCPAQNTTQCPRPGLEPRLLNLEMSTLTMRPPCLFRGASSSSSSSSSSSILYLPSDCRVALTANVSEHFNSKSNGK